jgi:hypothetical protein
MQAAQSPDRAARVKRIARRGCPEVIQALNRGELGIKTLERISRLPAPEQSIELARLVEARKANAQRQAAWRTDSRSAKAFYASQGYAEARKRRLRRIERTAIQELKAAYSEGRLSLRQYDLLSRLPPCQQRKAIESGRHNEQAQNLAALTIRAVLAQKPQRIDLGLITAKIVASIVGRPPLSNASIRSN